METCCTAARSKSPARRYSAPSTPLSPDRESRFSLPYSVGIQGFPLRWSRWGSRIRNKTSPLWQVVVALSFSARVELNVSFFVPTLSHHTQGPGEILGYRENLKTMGDGPGEVLNHRENLLKKNYGQGT